jgi:hypothetical protein
MVYLWPLAACITKSWLERELRCFTSAGIHAAQFAIKCWPQHTYSDISPQHEQKHLLHNRSNRCYRNRAQIARPILEVGLTVAIATSEESSLLMRIATLSVSLSLLAKGGHLELEVS